MKKCILYFEECQSNLSEYLLRREDIDLVILRTTKNIKYFSNDYLEKTSNNKVFVSDYENSIEEEIKKFKKWCNEKNIKLSHFLNDSEFYLEYSNNFARELNLETLSEKQISWVRDKVSMKSKFREVGLDTVDFKSVENKNDVIDYFNKNNQKPIIVKPRRGMNSIETYKIESLEDIENLPIFFKQNKYMVESFCYDREWSIESSVQDGIVLDSYVTYIPNPTIWATINNDLNCHMTVTKIPDYFKFVPKEYIQKIVDGMQLKNGFMTIEVFINSFGEIKASELGWRLPGCQATLNHSLSYGIDIYNILIDIMLHNKVTLNYNQKICSVGDLYLPNKEGIVSKITTIDELKAMDGVIDGQLFAKVGDYQTKRRVGNDASGWVLVKGENEQETFHKMKNIYDSFVLEVEREKEGKVYEKKL